MVTGYMRGHPIYYDDNVQRWKYTDTHEVALDNRPCKKCGRFPTKEGYDACLGYIEGATSACCGHGVERYYASFEIAQDKVDDFLVQSKNSTALKELLSRSNRYADKVSARIITKHVDV